MNIHGILLCFEFFQSATFVEHILVYGKCWIFLIDSVAFASLSLFRHGAPVLCVL